MLGTALAYLAVSLQGAGAAPFTTASGWFVIAGVIPIAAGVLTALLVRAKANGKPAPLPPIVTPVTAGSVRAGKGPPSKKGGRAARMAPSPPTKRTVFMESVKSPGKNRGLIVACVVAALLLVAALSITSPAKAEEVAARSASWELKGVRLGQDLAEVRARLPDLQCVEPGTGAWRCTDEHETIVGKPARMVVHALDGKVVSVRVNDMTRQQSMEVLNGLIAKYGDADKYKQYKGGADEMFGGWQDGEMYLVVNPRAHMPTRNLDHARGEVSLMDGEGFGKWKPRSYITNNQSTKPPVDL